MDSRVHWRVLNKTDGVGQQPAGLFSFWSELDLLFLEFMENEARSGAMDLTLSKSLTLGKAQVNLALL